MLAREINQLYSFKYETFCEIYINTQKKYI